MGKARNLDLRIVRKTRSIAKLTVQADPNDIERLQKLLLEAVRRDGWDAQRVNEFEMEVRYAGEPKLLRTVVSTPD